MIRLPVTTGLLAALLTLGGCSLLPESEPVAVYQYSQPPQDLASSAGRACPSPCGWTHLKPATPTPDRV